MVAEDFVVKMEQRYVVKESSEVVAMEEVLMKM